MIAGGRGAAVGGGLWGVVGGIPTAGAAIHDIEQCALPGWPDNATQLMDQMEVAVM